MTARSEQLVEEMRAWLLRSHALPHGPLPTVRSLVRRRGMKHHEVQSAYRQLKADGLIRSVPRVGLYAIPLSPALRRRRVRSVLRSALAKPIAAALREGLGPVLLRRELLSMVREMKADAWHAGNVTPPTHRCHPQLTPG